MRVGVLGGTFDPIHRGHMEVAGRISRFFELEKILFVVAKSPAHKTRQNLTDAFHRYAMAVLQTMGDERWVVSAQELQREGESYTIETLRELSAQFPEWEIGFVAGADSLRDLHKWNQAAELSEKHCLIFVKRPGIEIDPTSTRLSRDLREWKSGDPIDLLSGRSYLVEANTPDISSSAIRKATAKTGSPPSEMISPEVARYIQKYRLYL